MSAIQKLEARVAALEAEVATLKKKRTSPPETKSAHAWLDKIYGAFANDPEYLEAMRLGREYRNEKSGRKSRKR